MIILYICVLINYYITAKGEDQDIHNIITMGMFYDVNILENILASGARSERDVGYVTAEPKYVYKVRILCRFYLW